MLLLNIFTPNIIIITKLLMSLDQSEDNNLLKGFLKQSIIQPQKKEEITKLDKFFIAIDIFTFIPSPQSYPISTKRSRCGSMTLIIIFLAYAIYDFISFFSNNTPKANLYESLLPNQNYNIPQIAIGYIYGPALNQTLNDSSYFSIQFLQVLATTGQASKTYNLNLYPCPYLSWMGNLQEYYQNLSCINTTEVILSGILYASPLSTYARFSVNLCNSTNTTCATAQQIDAMIAGGRIYMFMERQRNIDFSSIKNIPKNVEQTYYVFNYFMDPGLYDRIILTIQQNIYNIYPDYMNRFKMETFNNMEVTSEQFQMSNVTNYNQLSLFSINIQLNSQLLIHDIVYTTILTHISMWGAFWGVLFGLFAFIFLAYNKRMFHQKNPDWRSFEQKIDKLDLIIANNKKNTQVISYDSKSVEVNSRRKTFDQIKIN